MGVLSSCWLIIEFFVIPDGWLWKWRYLRIYIHPLTLIPCQIFVWLKILIKWLSALVILISSIELYVYRLIIRAVLYVLSAIRVSINSNNSIHSHEDLDQSVEITQCRNRNHNPVFSCYTNLGPEIVYCEQQIDSLETHEYYDVEEEEEEEEGGGGFEDGEQEVEESASYGDSNANMRPNLYRFFDLSSSSVTSSNRLQENWMGDYLSSLDKSNLDVLTAQVNEDYLPYSLSSSSLSSPQVEWDEHLSSVCDSNSPILLGNGLEMDEVELSPSSACSSNLPLQAMNIGDAGSKPVYPDSFYQKYIERMGWFDLLNCERTYWLSAILEREMGSAASSLKNMELANFSIPNLSQSKAANRRLLRSIKSDFELVYVAQTCLSWEALVYHYNKVEHLIIASSASQSGISYHNVAREFQKFHVLLQRFMEDERLEEGKRYLKYAQARFSLKNLLQVPQLEGADDDECWEGEFGGKEVAPLNLREVSKAVDKCTKAFYKFVKTDNNKSSWWKFQSSFWSYPPVEDPRDLQLLADLTKIYQKKVLYLKDIQGKKKYLLNKAAKKAFEESQPKEILFPAIDLKLVSRVLQMTTISTSQLNWCQQKLDSITFVEGKIVRVETCPLFPP